MKIINKLFEEVLKNEFEKGGYKVKVTPMIHMFLNKPMNRWHIYKDDKFIWSFIFYGNLDYADVLYEGVGEIYDISNRKTLKKFLTKEESISFIRKLVKNKGEN